MFTISVLTRWSLFCLLIFTPTILLSNKYNKDTCVARGELIKDSTLSCCDGLQVVTEVGTKKKFCDKPASSGSKTILMVSIFAFPFLLFVFLLFGIRNRKMKNAKNGK